ncbi:hypothetical protein MOK15_04100 [Sphingobium sp. BYY-5]|uniref:hypothetical protein n=1 Tax=Sphingobium sp. BYY-5 TaxID=2926400 RepID=UPI001FA6BEC7|nr:hypothetical protein [Sphingobium sp. BYY-5]MCI4589282.1 hypothetical protein [Sphingobium sp. BYY-5]
MKGRLIGLAMLMVLAGCDGQAPKADSETDTGLVDDGKADCMTGSAKQWARDCLVERRGDTLTIRHPDGGFRRFRVLADGRGLESADGAEPATLSITGKRQIDVAAGDDRYRLPAQIADTVK